MNIANFEETITPLIKLALEEDIYTGDVTSEAIFSGTEMSQAYITAKEEGVFCGGEILKAVYNQIDASLHITQLIADGEKIQKGDRVMTIDGSTKSILQGERTALNFLQRMSGVSTKTSRIVDLVANTDIKILDTRKTLPGFRLLDKYAVKTGGGTNHRIGLFDMVMIKDNHIKAAGSITEAVKKVKNKWNAKFKIEVETTTLEEVREALTAKADIIMLDNMDKVLMKEAVSIINKKAKIEISGNMDEQKIAHLKDLAIDYISIGALTHSVQAFDLSMKFE